MHILSSACPSKTTFIHNNRPNCTFDAKRRKRENLSEEGGIEWQQANNLMMGRY